METKKIENLTDLEIAQEIGNRYQTIMGANNDLIVLNNEIAKRKQTVVAESKDGV